MKKYHNIAAACAGIGGFLGAVAGIPTGSKLAIAAGAAMGAWIGHMLYALWR